MTLRTKTLLAIAASLILLIAVLYVAISSDILGGFTEAEQRYDRAAMDRVVSSITGAVDDLDLVTRDWSSWDDTYQFVQDGNNAYKQSNLDPNALANLNLSMVAFVRPDGRVTFDSGVDPALKRLGPMPVVVARMLDPKGPLLQAPLQDKPLKGVLVVGESVMLVSARPILPSTGRGANHGVLLFGRTLTLDVRQQLNEDTRNTLDIRLFNGADLPADFQAAKAKLSASNPVVLVPQSSTLMQGYALVDDVFGNPALIVRGNINRSTNDVRQSATNYLILALLIAGFVFTVGALLLLERLVLARLTRLTKDVRAIGAKRDPSARVAPLGKDELGLLAATINTTLDDLQSALVREDKLKEEVKELKMAIELRIEVDRAKKDKEVSEITSSDYFQNLRQRADELRTQRSGAT